MHFLMKRPQQTVQLYHERVKKIYNLQKKLMLIVCFSDQKLKRKLGRTGANIVSNSLLLFTIDNIVSSNDYWKI